MEEQNNKVIISGEIVTNPIFAHETYGESFYEMNVSIKRLSGVVDVLPVTISERLMNDYDFRIGAFVNAVGQFRSYNKLINGNSKLMLTTFITDILEDTPVKNPNKIVLQGYICKPPVYRITPYNREITDILIAVNRSYNKSDYIPCIVWGRTAKFAKNFEVGDRIAIVGRIQSREYQKKIADDDVRTMTAYEVSVNKLYVGDNAENIENQELNGVR